MNTWLDWREAHLQQFRDPAEDARFLKTVASRNPWTKSNRNLTSQMRLHKLDPALAERLQGEAIAEDFRAGSCAHDV